MRYSFQCSECGYNTSLPWDFIPIGTYIPKTCDLCDGRLVRVASFSFHRPLQAHFNHAVGKPISSDREFRDALKQKSEDNWLRTGFESNLQPIDMHDPQSVGVTEEGLDSTRKELRDSGEQVPTRKVIY